MSLGLTNISHRFGAAEAVAEASLDVAAGEVVCLFGHSGCGKTTLLRLVAGLEPLQTGRVELDGAVLSGEANVPPEKRPIGFVFQDYVLFPHLTAAENVAFGIEARSGRKKKIRALEELKAVGLEGYGERYPHELSGGQQQRVALARALVRRPRAMLLDEPFAGIDAVLRRQLREDMRRILKDYGAATILVTHDPDEALALGDRIAIMKDGRLIETAPPKVLFESPSTPEGALIFAGAQRLDGVRENAVVRTPFGDVAAAGANGPVIVVALPGAARLVADPSGPALVESSRFTGPRWTSRLVADNAVGSFRVETRARLETGSRFRVDFDPQLTKLFPIGA